MNIIAVRKDGSFRFRPDSTLNHQFLDYYRPDAVTALAAVPVIYTRLTKAGKCVAERFAHRYFDSFAFGFLIDDRTDGVPEAMTFSMDQTSFMGMDFRPLDDLAGCRFSFAINGETRCTLPSDFQPERFGEAIAAITSRSMLRLGDIVALDLSEAMDIEPGDKITLGSDAGEHTISIL